MPRIPERLIVALLATFIGVASAQENAGFEDTEPFRGWSIDAEDDGVTLDAAVAHAGTHSLRLSQLRPDTMRVTQRISRQAISGNRIRLSGFVKTEVATGYAGLAVRVEDPDGLLFIDSMRDGGARGTTEWTRYELEAPFPADATDIFFGPILRGEGTAWFDDLAVEALDTATLSSPSAVAKRYIDYALAIMQTHSVRRDVIDWSRFRDSVLMQTRGAVTESDAHLALSYALRRLGDGHSFFMPPDRVQALNEEPFSNARTGRRAIEPRGELLADTFGYVWVPGFSGGDHGDRRVFAEQLQDTLRTLENEGACGWIVDLRGNGGGNLWPMLAGIGPLLGEGEVGASVYPDGRRVPVWYRDGQAGFGKFTQLRVSGEPYSVRNSSPPVALLTGRGTASSAEVLVMAFRGRPGTRSFGADTRGVSTGNRTFPLSDGAELILTVAATSDRNGRVYTGAIEPDEPTERSSRNSPLAGQPAVAAAMRWLAQQSSCHLDGS